MKADTVNRFWRIDSQMQKDREKGDRARLSQRSAQGNLDSVAMNIDGAARGNPGPAGIGAVIRDGTGEILTRISEYIGEATNNVAEYSALIFALQTLAECRPKRLRIFSDSELLVHQLNGDYKVKNVNIKTYFGWAKGLLEHYSDVQIIHVERQNNREADELANEAIDKFLAGEKSAVELGDLPTQQQLF